MRQVDNYAREKSSLGQTEQESDSVELERGFHEGCERSDDSPGDHDAADPLPGAPFLDNKCARDLEDKIPDEKYTGAEANYGIVESREILGHLDRGK